MRRITLCSYTYNDAALLHGLLAEVRSWATAPDEIILIDDGSDRPFELTAEEKTLPLRLIRQPENMGFTRTKHRAMCEAAGDIIVSLDCDVKLSGDFAGNAADILRDPEVGLVGPSEQGAAGRDLLSAYLSIPGLVSGGNEGSETTFVNGPALAIRRDLWNEIGGYGGHPLPRGSDQYLSRLLLAKGYRLRIDHGSQTKCARVLTRHAFCRRDWKWCGHGWLAELRPKDTLPEYALTMLLQTRWRCAEIIAKHNPVWVYFEILRLLHIYLEFCNALGPAGMLPTDAGSGLVEIVNKKIAPYPSLLRLLKADLMRAGALPLKAARPPAPENNTPLARACAWGRLAELLDEFDQSLVLEYLEKAGVRAILSDEASLEADFSSY